MVRLQTSEKSHKKLFKVEIFKFLFIFQSNKKNYINHINDDKEAKTTEKKTFFNTHTQFFTVKKQTN